MWEACLQAWAELWTWACEGAATALFLTVALAPVTVPLCALTAVITHLEIKRVKEGK